MKKCLQEFLIKIKMIIDILKSRPTSYIGEWAYFKYNFRRYWHKKSKNGEVEFWCHPTKLVPDCFLKEVNESYFLGKVSGGQIVKPENFYQLPWDVQKGALRLFQEYENKYLK